MRGDERPIADYRRGNGGRGWRFIGAPYGTGYGTILYAAFKAKFVTLPNSNPDYFAHFANGTTLRARIYPFIPTNAPFGMFHLAVGNAIDSAEFPNDLTTNVSYTLVTRYAVDTATTTLWVNPTNETDTGENCHRLSIAGDNFRIWIPSVERLRFDYSHR